MLHISHIVCTSSLGPVSHWGGWKPLPHLKFPDASQGPASQRIKSLLCYLFSVYHLSNKHLLKWMNKRPLKGKMIYTVVFPLSNTHSHFKRDVFCWQIIENPTNPGRSRSLLDWRNQNSIEKVVQDSCHQGLQLLSLQFSKLASLSSPSQVITW